MGKSQETWNKKEKEKKRQRKKEDKQRKKEIRQENSEGGELDSMMAYVDEFGNIVDEMPDPAKKTKFKAKDMVIGVPTRIEEEMDPIRKGKVTFFDNSKGYGFIRDSETQESVFSHINSHIDDNIGEHSKVTFEVEMGPKGPNAVNVKLAE